MHINHKNDLTTSIIILQLPSHPLPSLLPPLSVVMCYFQLCGENYLWQWRSVTVAASSGIYLFLYSCFYFFSALKITRFVSIVLYFGYSFVMATGFSLMTGCIGFLSCKWFVGKIYTYIKLD